jgi:beta-lactamase superfamily II metal-dependent hydrolase
MHLYRSLSRSAARAAAWALLGALAFAQQLEVRVINVDQGLSVFVKSPAGTRLLIDGGNPGDGTAIVRPYLQSIGVTGLDYSVMTHWHTDHFGGLTEIHNSAYKPVVAAYDRGDNDRPSNGFVTSYLSAVSGKRAIATIGQTLDLGGGATLQFLSRDAAWSGGSVSADGDENSRSLGMVLRYGDFDLYVAGDLTAGGLGTPNVEGPVSVLAGQVEVAISSHHGSSSSSSNTVVSNLNPSLVIHSAGHDNPYGHPTETVVNAWSPTSATRVQWCTTEGDTVLATGGDPGAFNAVNGTILITSDGATFTASSPATSTSIEFATFEQPGVRAAPAQVVVNELLIDPLASSDSHGEWFELKNVSSERLNLGGMQFQSGAQTFTLRSQALLAPGAQFVVGVDGRRSRNGNVFPGVNAPWQMFTLPNSSGALTLRSSTGLVMETVSWGAGAISVQPGVSAERIQPSGAPTASNFAPALTSWSGGDKGTPWAPNDNEQPLCPLPLGYGVGKLTSNLTSPSVAWTGTPSLDTNDFAVRLVDGMPLKSTIAFWGTASAAVPFLGGTRYVATPVQRMGLSQTDVVGSVTYPVPIDATMPGTKRYYQFWFRDPFQPDGTGVGLSAALEVQFCPLAPPAAKGDVVITEFLKDPTAVADSAGEWIELYNTTAFTLNLEGWRLVDDGGDDALLSNGGAGIFVGPGQRIVVGVNANSSSNGGVSLQASYSFTAFRLDNTVDEIALIAPNQVEVDRVEYDNVIWPTLPGHSVSLEPATLDHLLNDDPNRWCSSSTPFGLGIDTGTPGAANDICP